MVWLELSARRKLTRLHDQYGVAGLAAAASIPGLAAVVDQHAAAVRDILAFGVEGAAALPAVVLLAGYAAGLLDHAREHDYRPELPSDWHGADWLIVRLVAVCAHAKTLADPRYRFDPLTPAGV